MNRNYFVLFKLQYFPPALFSSNVHYSDNVHLENEKNTFSCLDELCHREQIFTVQNN